MTLLNPYRPDPTYQFHDARTAAAVQHAYKASQAFRNSGFAKARTHWSQCLQSAIDSAYNPSPGTPTPEILYAYQLAVRACMESQNDKTARTLIPDSLTFAAKARARDITSTVPVHPQTIRQR